MRCGLFVAACLVIAAAASAQTAQAPFVRPSDPQVRGLIYEVDRARDRFEGALDSEFKRSILRSPTGEVNVGKYLDDFQRNAGQLKDRYKDEYAASTEALTLLKQCTSLNTFMTNQPATFKGRSEWDAMVVLLSNLATMYGTAFPTPDAATARRMNDKEVAQAAEVVSKSADEFRKITAKSMKAAKADPQAVTAMERELKTLTATAKALKSQLSSHKASTNEARLVLDQAVRVQTVVTTPPSAPDPAASYWDSMQKNLQSIRLSFGMAGM